MALNEPCETPISHPPASAASRACSSVGPTIAISGCVKHAAGIASWLRMCSSPHMFSTAEMPCADDVAVVVERLHLLVDLHEAARLRDVDVDGGEAEARRVGRTARADHARVDLEGLDM